jgi:hypothetical protein
MRSLFSLFRILCALFLWTTGFSFVLIRPAQAQERRRIVQFTGMVTSGDSLVGVPDVMVYVPKSSRHTLTNAAGYFSLAVLAGDSVVIRAPAYMTQVFIPPAYPHQSYATLVQIPAGTFLLPEAHPSFPSFKREFLTLKTPPEPNISIQEDYNKASLKLIFDQANRKRRLLQQRQLHPGR